MAAGDEHFTAIGRLAHEFALLEHYVSTCIWTALGDVNDRRFRAVTTETSWNAKLRLLEALVGIVEPEDESEHRRMRKKQWSQFFRDAESAAADRNRLLHAPIGSSTPAEVTTEITTLGIGRSKKNRGALDFKSYTPSSIDEATDRIKAVRRAIWNLTIPVKEEMAD